MPRATDQAYGTAEAVPLPVWVWLAVVRFAMPRRHVSLLFVPGEYVRNYPDCGPQLKNFSSRFGIVLPISR